jgi:hypothetical protein
MSMKKNKVNYAEMAVEVKSFLERNQYLKYHYPSGFYMMESDNTILFSVNIASDGPPTEEQTSEMLFTTLDYYNHLNSASEDFKNYTTDKKFIASLDVSSGQMDFIYAQLIDGKIVK